MPVWIDFENTSFPPFHFADETGLLAIGGDLSPKRLMTAYRTGIFPWYEEDQPICWYAPPERMVLFFEQLKISKSMRSFLRKHPYHITRNKAFSEVIDQCQNVKRFGESGTWITAEMKMAYIKLHQLGYAHSWEVWEESRLVGGLYGVDLGHVFCGESMFSLRPNTSKLAFIELVTYLQKNNYQLLDCQVYNNHLASLGAVEIPREEFMKVLKG